MVENMTSVLIMFFTSLLICCATAYMLGLFWFSDIRNRRFRSFFLLGIEMFFWTLLNAITMVVDVEFFPIIYTLRMIFVCIVPFGVAWFILNFTNSPLRNKRIVLILLIAIPLLDIIFLITNPFHYLYFSDYNYSIPTRATLFWAHVAVTVSAVLMGFFILVRFILKQARSHPILIFTGFTLMSPYILNMMYTFGMISFPYDTTPIGSFLTMLLFVFAAHKLRLFNVKTFLFASTMDSIKDIIILLNPKQIIMDVNQSTLAIFNDFAFVTGHTSLDTFSEYLRKEIKNEEFDNLMNHLKSKHVIEGEFSIALHDGQQRTYSLTWNTVYERKKVSGHILMMTDVSNYKQMIGEINDQNKKLFDLKEQAEAASKTKGEFLSRMSHEMRTPMNAVIGMTQVALQNKNLNSDLENYLLKIKGASNHLLGVINDVLDMSKIESGKFSLFETNISLEELLKNISIIADIQIEQKQQHFLVTVDDTLPPVLIVDGQRLTQVITNLLSNAFKFTPADGTITFTINVEDRQEDSILLRFEITDTGIGISEEQLMHLFKPFEQADGSITRNFGGTGLGLVISKNIIELMGGNIRVESKLGFGTSFIFTIYAKEGNETSEYINNNVNSNELENQNEFEGCHILLAEDIEINREIILSLLNGSGVVFDIAENGEAAVEMYKTAPKRYHMIFMDIQMPKMNGFMATTAIRSTRLDTAHSIPIIAMTANAFKEDIDACLAAGMNDHLAKPIDIEKVKNIISKYYQAHGKN